MTKQFTFSYQGNDYPVSVTYKRSRTISYRYKDHGFIVYAPIFTREKTIMDGLNKFAKRLINENAHATGEDKNYIYILGHKYDKNLGYIPFSDGSKLVYEDETDLKKKLKKWFKDYITKRNRMYEKMMGAYENKISVRDMSTRYGSNTPKNHSIRYSLVLMHFSSDVIDAIIVHELAHCFIRGHGKDFYKLVYQYCPNYDKLHYRLRKGIFLDEGH